MMLPTESVQTATGLAGLMLGHGLFPRSNLLGGFAVLVGPIDWFGTLAMTVYLIGLAVSSTASGFIVELHNSLEFHVDRVLSALCWAFAIAA